MPQLIRIALFLLLWREIARCFALGADAAFLVALAIAFGTAVVAALDFELAGLPQQLTARLVTWGVLWLLLFAWLAPAFVKSPPISFILCAVIALIVAGGRLHAEAAQHPEIFGKQYLRQHSEVVAGSVLVLLGAAMLAEQHWHSVLPLVGYLALFTLPLAFGWLFAAHPSRRRFDASFGNAEDFRRSGASEEL